MFFVWLLSGCFPGSIWIWVLLGIRLGIPGGRDPTRCLLHVGGSWETINAQAFIVCKEHLKSDNYRCHN